MRFRFVRDVGGLPNHAFGPDSILWWGTLGYMALEGMAFVLAVATYFYLMRDVPNWPPGGIWPSPTGIRRSGACGGSRGRRRRRCGSRVSSPTPGPVLSIRCGP